MSAPFQRKWLLASGKSISDWSAIESAAVVKGDASAEKLESKIPEHWRFSRFERSNMSRQEYDALSDDELNAAIFGDKFTALCFRDGFFRELVRAGVLTRTNNLYTQGYAEMAEVLQYMNDVDKSIPFVQVCADVHALKYYDDKVEAALELFTYLERSDSGALSYAIQRAKELGVVTMREPELASFVPPALEALSLAPSTSHILARIRAQEAAAPPAAVVDTPAIDQYWARLRAMESTARPPSEEDRKRARVEAIRTELQRANARVQDLMSQLDEELRPTQRQRLDASGASSSRY